MSESLRWGLLGTANIAAKAFLPALSAVGGRAVTVGSRTVARGAAWALQNDVERSGSYRSVIEASDVDAVYVALPNDQHARWSEAAVLAGKAVLCEKPIALTSRQAEHLISQVGVGGRLWESFVFTFHPQTSLLGALIESDHIGDLREIISEFHFHVDVLSDNIRLRRDLGGGALYDVGCYPVRLARLLFGGEPVSAVTAVSVGPSGVELDVASILEFSADRRLVLSAGMRRPTSTFTRLVGTAGELRVSNPFHPTIHDTVELWVEGRRMGRWNAADGSAFRHGIEHIQRATLGVVEPRHIAGEDAIPQARAMDLVRESALMGGLA